MRPELPRALLCAALIFTAAGCRMDGDGLSGKIAAPPDSTDQPTTPNVVGGNVETPKPPKADNSPPTVGSADASAAGAMPPAVAADAGAPPETTVDAAPVSAPDVMPTSSQPTACAQPLMLPVSASFRREVPDSDDFTFDGDGYFLARSGRDIARLEYGGMPQMIVHNAVDGRSTIDSLRVLPGGDIVIADYEGDQLLRVGADQKSRRLASVQSPNKVALGPGGRVYVAGYDGDVFAVDPDSGKVSQLARIDGRLRGLTFSLDYKTLYVSDAHNGVLHALSLHADGSAEPPRLWVRNIGSGPDGMTTDACGNIYVADHENPVLHRVTPDGTAQVIANLNNGPTSSVGFGSGQHGWDAQSLYTVSVDRGGTYEIKLGVSAAPPPP